MHVKYYDKTLHLAGVEARIRTTEPLEPRIISRVSEMKTKDSDERSLGYETMTTLSDPDSVVSKNLIGYNEHDQHD